MKANNIKTDNKHLANSITSITPRKSLLSLAIAASIGCIAGISQVFAAETASCVGIGNCTDIKSSAFGKSKVLTTSFIGNATISLESNTVTLDYTGAIQPTINYVYGAYTRATGQDVKGNEVLIKNGKATKEVYGGYSRKGNATGNSVTITSDGEAGKVFGGFSNQGDVKGNMVNISGGIVSGNIFGGRSSTGDATGNIVKISGNTETKNIRGGASINRDATDNRVTISSGKVDGNIRGGRGAFKTKGNSVTITGGDVTGQVFGGFSINDYATSNSVTISGGSVTNNVFGGQSQKGDVTGNIVIISGGSVTGNVFGGRSKKGDVTGNTVTIAAGSLITFGTDTVLYGGKDKNPSTSNPITSNPNDVITDNTLNIHRKDVSVKDVKNFENYNFYINSTVKNNDTLLTLTSEGTTDLSNANITLGVETTNGHLQKGHKVTLIKKTNANLSTELKLPTSMIAGTPILGIAGVSTLFDFKVSADTNNKQLVAKLDQRRSPPAPSPAPSPAPEPGRLNPQTKAFLETGAATTNFVSRGVDLAESAGFDALVATQATGNTSFGAMSAGKYRTETGSHIDVSGAEFMLGVGKNFDNSAGILNIGAFAEFGTGSFDAHNDFVGVPDVNSSGDAKYYGLGLMAEQEFTSGLSVKGGMSFGRTESDFNTTDILNSRSNVTSFDSNRDYFSAFAGIGYDVAINTSSKVNVYADIKHTNLSSDEQTIAGEKFHFDEINSTRTTLGARWSKDINTDGNVYAGAAWEHEFNGTASGSFNNRALAEPSLEGDTGIFEAGFEFNPANNKNLNITIGAQGTVGKRQGASANASLLYDF